MKIASLTKKVRRHQRWQLSVVPFALAHFACCKTRGSHLVSYTLPSILASVYVVSLLPDGRMFEARCVVSYVFITCKERAINALKSFRKNTELAQNYPIVLWCD